MAPDTEPSFAPSTYERVTSVRVDNKPATPSARKARTGLQIPNIALKKILNNPAITPIIIPNLFFGGMFKPVLGTGFHSKDPFA